jgi:hypothetical protein
VIEDVDTVAGGSAADDSPVQMPAKQLHGA